MENLARINSQLGIDCLEGFPDVGALELKQQLNDAGVSVEVHTVPVKMYASLEFLIPTAICAYLAKPYFDGFFKEAGKDHYILIKEALSRLSERAREIPMKKVTASESTNKGGNSYSQSFAFSTIVHTKKGRVVKFLFDNNLDQDAWDGAIDQMLVYVSEDQAKVTKSIEKELEDLKPAPHIIYAIINPETKRLNFHDDMTLYRYLSSLEKLSML